MSTDNPLQAHPAVNSLDYIDKPIPISDKDASASQISDSGVPGTWDIFKKTSREGWGGYAFRMCREGQSVPDAFLTVAASRIGQVMLTTPNALWKAGVVSGGLWMTLTSVMSLFTMYLMSALYVERKRKLLADGKWHKAGSHVTQYHDVLGFHLGPWIRFLAQAIIAMQLFATGVAQVIACAADYYSIDKTRSKRELQLIWGAVLQLFCFFPSFKHFRLLNIFALIGTTFTAIYFLDSCRKNGYDDIDEYRPWPAEVPNSVTTAPNYFFDGSAVLLNAIGSHSIAYEMMDVMETPQQYMRAYTGGWLWTICLVIPHSIAINLAFPLLIAKNENAYGVFPINAVKKASVGLMIFHQLAAFTYYVTPLQYMWERIIRTHNSPWYIRMPSRVPLSLLIWLAAMAFPFYGNINSLYGALSAPLTAMALPCIGFLWIYRTREQRNNSAQPPSRWLRAFDWKPIFVLCAFGAVFYLGYAFVAVAYAIKSIVDASKAWGVFARCYQCAKGYEKFLRNPGNKL